MLSDQDRADQLEQATRERLRQFVARIERLEAEKAELAADIREVYSEVKTFGLDTKVMRRIISLRKKEAAERAEMDALTDMYMSVVEDQDYDTSSHNAALDAVKKSKKKKSKKNKKNKKSDPANSL